MWGERKILNREFSDLRKEGEQKINIKAYEL
ncbi:hypothetical protein G681_04910 [Escherichia coli HVH 1 (4-6876161)]|nr:hypothetical protein WFL_23855 [Escherichia coli W]EQM99156.1 hypothetical protein G681_04910 [Escherichia coli HVH 1 (4-6876161)]